MVYEKKTGGCMIGTSRNYDVSELRAFAAQWVASAVLLPVCVIFVGAREEIIRSHFTSAPALYRLLDTLTLVVHEAGHFFFHFFGDFMAMAGGTVLQLLLPCILIWHFFYHQYRLGVQLALLWLGQSLVSVSIYANDARARVLPLLGGDTVGHDWYNMLTRLDLLLYDWAVSYFFFGLALLVFLLALGLPLVIRSR